MEIILLVKSNILLYNLSMLLENEEIFDLECHGLKIIQSRKGYAFTTDAVLLANTVKAYRNETVVELGSGSGVISLLLSKKTPAKELVGIELQPRLAEMASRSIKLNQLEDRVRIINCNMKEAHLRFDKGVDVVCVNPPYMEYDGNPEEASEIDVCKREVFITLKEVVECASRLLKYGGRFYLIVKAERLTDLISAMREYKIEPKALIPVQPTLKKDIDTVIIEGRKNGNNGIKVFKPLVICNEDGSYTKEVEEMYRK